MSVKITGVLISVVVLAGVFWLLRPTDPLVEVPEEISSSLSETVVVEVASPETSRDARGSAVMELVDVSSPPLAETGAEPTQEPAVPGGYEVSVEEATDSILHLIPEWLLDSGDVLREHVQVVGQWAGRVRSRYSWPNGSQVEVEVTDLGSSATADQFKSLGFDFDLQAEATNGTLRIFNDPDDTVFNLEYDEEDGSGHVQYIVAGRYLMEVQLERLPLESFQVMEDRDGLLKALLQSVHEPAD